MAKRIVDFVPIFLSLVAFIFVLLILLGGVGNQLADIFFLKINTSALKLPSVLSNADLLRDISILSGTDFIGGDLTASTLGLATEYTISLLTFCARTSSGASCSSPQIKFWFDPGQHLRLDSTSLRQQYPGGYTGALSSYRSIATRFLPGAFVFCALSAGLTVLLSALSALGVARASTGRAAAVFAILATVVLLMADAAATHVFRVLDAEFNSGFGAHGLSSSLGAGGLALAWLALLLMLGAAAAACVRLSAVAAEERRGRGLRALNLGAGEKRAAVVTPAPARKGGILSRIPGLNRHKYAQVEDERQQRQMMLGRDGYGGAAPRGADAGWMVQDDYSAERYSDRGRADGIAMRSLSSSPPARTVANTAYEPYGRAG
ncbi:hypothetical protein MCOR03_000303 [Pyricularia oryzae]|uniref:Pali-domain-containing protein n=1 Tax=Pyricularia grisea TaxID=148305 RepID=A0ABQ8NXA4_PYRGI|nr:hypothetical protein MCOR01_006779 [Pyricularia oryzae]KAI6302951.1 hypothetical protein MCOR33_001861 [Pyricularia grisea]KAI6287338.1 hypothetical protein MCOR26_000590 [Pyricularia oryzae]KAI6349837.1 hypothetical protein MCOR28_000618 [Pyricularia oryzae]KAI6357873.1 hypothetical protein MCOR31_010105 [Pyricularia oryzae]